MNYMTQLSYPLTMHGDNIYSEILGLNAESIWFGSLFGIQKMLSGFKEWELDKICNGNDDTVEDFAWRVSFFHEKTLMPVMQYIKNNHTPPSFAVDALKDIPYHGRNQIFELHAKLLCGASEKLIQFYDNNCGSGGSVIGEIKKWFAVLQKGVLKAFGSFVSSDTIADLQQIVDTFDMNKDTCTGKASSRLHQQEVEKEYLFFCHKFLFIHIAYMVEFYTNANAMTRNQVKDNDYAFLALGNDQRKKWGNVSGNLIQRLFQNDGCGLPVLDVEVAAEGYIEQCMEEGKFKFPIIDFLPYKEFAESTRKNRGQPSLSGLQESVLCEMFGKIRAQCSNEMGRRDREQLKKLEQIFSVAVHSAETELHTLRNREKVRKCLKKKRAKHSISDSGSECNANRKRQRQRQGPNIFMWDVFIMGNNSYFHIFKDLNGAAVREFYKKCNARGQLFRDRNI